MKLRNYQEDALTAIGEQLAAVRSTLVVSATGTGKTVMFAHAIERFSKKRTLVLAHRTELIRQAADKIERITGEAPEIEMGSERADLHIFRRAKVVVASKDTLHPKRLRKFNPADFDLLIVDEFHHAVSKSYRHIFDYFKDAKMIGVTATPERSDEKALGQVVDSVAYVYEILDAINDGWLVPVDVQSKFLVGLDFSKIKSTSAGDLNEKQLAEVMEHEKQAQAIVDETVRVAKWRKTLLFAASVKAAEMICEITNRHKANSARCVFGETDTDVRKEIFKDYRAGRFQYLIGVGVMTEGWDEPTVEMIAMARPTESRALFSQMIGRGTRSLEGVVDNCEDSPEARKLAIARSRKGSILILDFEGNAGRHKLITTANILGGKYDDEVVAMAERKIRESSAPMPVAQALKVAEADLTREREIARRQKLIATATYETKTVDPFNMFDLAPKREREWDRGKAPSQAQIEYLVKNGVDTTGMTKAVASQLIGEIIDRRKKGKCSYKQAKLLRKNGLDPNLSFEDAKKAIDEIAARQGWKKKEEFAT